MLTIAYIGNGKSTNRYHLPFALKQKDKIKVKSILHREGSPYRWEKIEGVHYVPKLEDILSDPEIELVVVCTQIDTHYDFAMKVLQAGKHVLVEKPFTETSEQAQELFDYAKEHQLFIQCYQNRRFDSDFLTVQQVIESGKLGDILEVEMHYDYFRPEIPESVHEFSKYDSYLYGHGCHTIDQVLSYFGSPESIHYDVRQLLGPNRMNDYFDLDFFYPTKKVSVKSSYFRLKERPSFVVYGTKGSFVKETKDRQEEHLKLFYMPTNADFGIDLPQHYGTLTYMDEQGSYHEEKVVSAVGDYSQIYAGIYNSIVNGSEKIVKDHQTLEQMHILEAGVAQVKPFEK